MKSFGAHLILLQILLVLVQALPVVYGGALTPYIHIAKHDILSHIYGKESRSVLDVILGDPRFSRLGEAINTFPEVVNALSRSSASLTVFAPTNDAWDSNPNPPSEEDLLHTLLYHVINVRLESRQLHAGDLLPTLYVEPALHDQNQEVKVSVVNDDLYINHAHIIEADISGASNGVVHAIDSLLTLPDQMDHVIVYEEELQVLSKLVRYSNLADKIGTTEALTLFAPSDAAFDKISPALRRFLLTPVGRPLLERILKYHVVPELIYSSKVPAEEVTLPTLLGVKIQIRRDPKFDDITINGYATVKTPDVIAQNGVIHIIDEVLIPVHERGSILAQLALFEQ